jgi:hypothetical protein
MFRLVRGNQHILDVLDVLHRDRLGLRIHDGAFSAMDLTARHPRTGELLSTVKFMVQPLAAALARQCGVSRGAVRTAVADLMPEHTDAGREDAPAPELSVTLDMPGKVADFLHAAERAALDQGVTVRRGQGYTLRVSAQPQASRSATCPFAVAIRERGRVVVAGQARVDETYEGVHTYTSQRMHVRRSQ